jgi:hypothetical protein
MSNFRRNRYAPARRAPAKISANKTEFARELAMEKLTGG